MFLVPRLIFGTTADVRCCMVGSLVLVSLVACVSRGDESLLSYNRDIRPILSENCFRCHGPDANAREADLRLDRRDEASADLGGYAAIVPGQARASAVIHRVMSSDPDEVMPPPDTKKSLSLQDKKRLARWIDQGAVYQDHWSFRPIRPVDPPEVRNADWVRNDIDRFILSRLEARNIRPAPAAQSSTLVRRVYIDLVGLLPPPEVVQRFVASDDPRAYEQLVDDLLASKHYGERWGRHWLDQARYADSHGYTIDGERTMWPYRDWVIKSLNDDMPFDQFTIEQLAGDLLPAPTKSQLVASGFHRNTLINQEGGTDDEQFRNEEVVDRISTTGAVWLGLTVGCAQCHSHKYDPISQREFYELFAFFNQSEDVNDTGPTVEVAENELFLDRGASDLRAQWEAAKSKVAALQDTRSARQTTWERELRAAIATEAAPVDWQPLVVTELRAAGGAELSKLDDGSILASRGAGMETYTLRCLTATDQPLAALRLRVLPHESLPRGGPGLASNGNFILTDVEIRRSETRLTIARAQASHAQPKFPIELAIDDKPDTGWAINVAAGSSKKMNAPHEAHFVLAEPTPAHEMPLTIMLRHAGNASHYNIGRFALDGSPTVPPPWMEPELARALATDLPQRSEQQQKRLQDRFAAEDHQLRRARERVARLAKELGLGPSAKVMVMRNRGQPRETYVHVRGDFLRPDQQTGLLQPDVPAVFPRLLETDATPTRLQLAQWLIRSDHPLTARVTVNRVWMRYFGRGLVETENDFGTQGTYPTHPKLLDWLAERFITDGWSWKRLHRLIVTSATYRQASLARGELAEVDPRNQLLARQNRLRFEAEIVRDAALSASGLLEPRIGGPSVRPPQPDGVYAFTQRKITWTPASGRNRFRRAMYTQFYRSAPYPLLTTFDSPDFQSVCTARSRSNTPLQSLTLANDASVFELAQGLALRLLYEVAGTDDQSRRRRIQRAFLICFSRQPSAMELEAVARFQQLQLSRFDRDGQDAAAKVAPADYPENFSAAMAASWTAVARALINTDEFITRE